MKIKRGFLILLSFVVACPLSATTYFVANAGNDSNNGTTSATPWQTISKVNASTFNPGDSILFQNGGTWHETLSMPSSGSAGSPITVGNYGSGPAPIISGANVILGGNWRAAGGTNQWSATVTTQPSTVIFNESPGIHQGSLGGVTAAYTWYWASTVLTVYSIGNPGFTYTAPGIQAGTRNKVIQLGATSYVTIQNLIVEGGNVQGIDFTEGNASNITISNNEVRYIGGSSGAIQLGSATSGGGHNIMGNTIHDNALDAVNIFLNSGSTSRTPSYIQNNTMYNNGGHGVENRGNYFIIQYNLIHDNGYAEEGHGIHTFTGSSSEGTGNNNTIRFNLVYNQSATDVGDGQGIELDQWTVGNNVLYNVAYNNQGACITLYDAASVNLYGNSCYGNETGDVGTNCRSEIMLVSSSSGLTTNVIAKNNIAYATTASVPAICVDSATAANTLTISQNDWFALATNWWSWAGTTGSNLTTWNAFTGVSSDLNSDPLYLNASVGNLTLTAGSPAIDTGANLGSTYQSALFSTSAWPRSVAIANQNSYGTGWEIGAFVFTNSSAPNAPQNFATINVQ